MSVEQACTIGRPPLHAAVCIPVPPILFQGGPPFQSVRHHCVFPASPHTTEGDALAKWTDLGEGMPAPSRGYKSRYAW